MPYGITSGRGDFPAFAPTEAGIRFSYPEGCKAELTWVVVIFQDSLPHKHGHLFQKQPGSVMAGSRAETASRESNVLTTRPLIEPYSAQV